MTDQGKKYKNIKIMKHINNITKEVKLPVGRLVQHLASIVGRTDSLRKFWALLVEFCILKYNENNSNILTVTLKSY